MKITVFAAITLAGMTATSVAVWSATGPARPASERSEPAPALSTAPAGDDALSLADSSSFLVGDTLMMEGRLGHAVIPSDRSSESFLFVDIKADATKQAATPAALNLAIVIDRSGSMRGKRLKNALAGARTALDQLRDGDVVSVVTYSQSAEVIVSPTVIDPASRPTVLAALNKIRANGETCISCGIDVAMRMARANQDKVTRIVLLSDGEATVGVQDLGGFTRIAEGCRKSNMAISTIGVDVNYNERIMAALARVSNGRHHFVDRPDQLATIFQKEMESLTRTLASNAEVTIDLEPGVFVDHVFDRAFERRGNQLIVPFGTFAQNDRKTLLVRLRLPNGPDGDRPVAAIKFRYDDLAESTQGSCEGELIAQASSDPTSISELDALVAGRLTLSETAASLEEANVLFSRGDAAGARGLIRSQISRTESRKRAAAKSIPVGRSDDFDAAFGKSSDTLSGGGAGFDPAAGPREAEAQTRQNQAEAFDLGL